MKIIVSQIGAREHYAVARALHEQGMLAALVTDWYAFGKQNTETQTTEKLKSKWNARRLFRYFGALALQRFGGASARAARCEAIPDELVHAFPFRSLFWKWQVRRLKTQGRLYEAYARTDAAFARAVANLEAPQHDVFFGYSYASLETLEAEKKRGALCVLDQIDPGAVEFRLVAEEMARHPEMAGPPPPFPAAYYERNRCEWELADVIVVNSEWSREAIIAEGADAGKIEILPLGFEAEDRSQKSKSGKLDAKNASSLPCVHNGALRVLWLGQVNVRKGIHYLLEAARSLEGKNIQFNVVGPIGISEAAVKSAPSNARFHGPVSRDRAAEWYRQSDVFVLPTLSDGFALTQLEALAYGVPVIATPNCGRVVKDGQTGFIVPARGVVELADAILKFGVNRNLSASMAPACRATANEFSVEAYGNRLLEILRKHAEKLKS